MDWFQRWPKDALVAVSNHFLANYDIVCTADVKKDVVQAMGEFQVNTDCKKYWCIFDIFVTAFVTFFGFLSLICLFLGFVYVNFFVWLRSTQSTIYVY